MTRAVKCRLWMFYSLPKGESFVDNEFARQTYFVLRSFTYNAHSVLFERACFADQFCLMNRIISSEGDILSASEGTLIYFTSWPEKLSTVPSNFIWLRYAISIFPVGMGTPLRVNSLRVD